MLANRTIAFLVANGTIVERDISGHQCIGLREAVERHDKEMAELASSPRGRAEAALHEAALEAHPGWRKREHPLLPSRWVWENDGEAADRGRVDRVVRAEPSRRGQAHHG